MISENISVDILLSTYNWPQALESIFLSIISQSKMPNQILIADDGSDYKTQLLIEKYKRILDIPIIHVWQADDGFRKTLILNKAMKFAKSDYIIQIDGDVVLHRHFIKDHIRNAKRKSFVQGSRVILNGVGTTQCLTSKRRNYPFFSRRIKNRINATRVPFLSFLIKTDPLCSRNIKACNIAFWREDFVAVNGYDNLFYGWGLEDDEFAARLINFGVKKRRLKLAAICYHLDHVQKTKIYEARNKKMYNETVLRKKIFSADGLAQV